MPSPTTLTSAVQTDLDVGSVLWLGGHVILFLQHLKLKAKVVNRDGVLAGIVLQHTYNMNTAIGWLIKGLAVNFISLQYHNVK